MATLDHCVTLEMMERWQGRVLRWMTGVSVVGHVIVIMLGATITSLFPPAGYTPVVTVELTDVPLSTLPEEEPPPPMVEKRLVDTPRVSNAPAVPRKTALPPPSAEKWLKKLDTRLGSFQDAPVSRGMGKTGGIPVRKWVTGSSPGAMDFPPAVAPENKALLKQISDLESRVRGSGVPGIGTGEEIEASMMFGGTGTSEGEPIPEWIRNMIRNRVRSYLPELEALYSAAYRRNPTLKGRLLVRFRIDPSGRIEKADSVDASFDDTPFVSSVLQKVRGWTFNLEGRSVEVIYPFVFIAPT
ncbi:MAG TPA: AgmX/PglI C-terminal domain-containing protein [Nitrospiria bacterium]|nr:AgmX/PglI C-terminal domain-containing protein [Nitrospiria bacterium]